MIWIIQYINHWNLQKQNKIYTFWSSQQRRQREPDVKTLPFSTFRWILEALHAAWQRNSTPRFASTPERWNENKHFISPSGDRTHNQSRLQSHFVPLRPYWPQLFGHYYILRVLLAVQNVTFSPVFIDRPPVSDRFSDAVFIHYTCINLRKRHLEIDFTFESDL